MLKVKIDLASNYRDVVVKCNNKEDDEWITLLDYILSSCLTTKIIDSDKLKISRNEFLSNIEPYLDYYIKINFIVDASIKKIVDENQIIEQNISVNDLYEKLKIEGFNRSLKWKSSGKKYDFQEKSVLKMIKYNSAASFSVPGSGKTTEALAYYAFKKDKNTKIVVICPKNAFQSWDNELNDRIVAKEKISGCFSSHEKFYRIQSKKDIELKLKAKPNLLINYERINSIKNELSEYLKTTKNHNVILILDESHRMKAGYRGQWGTNILSLSDLPKYKLILTGTPCPNSKEDLVAQFDFLFPTIQWAPTSIDEMIQPHYVRTTKKDLGLPEPKIFYDHVTMNLPQEDLYNVIVDSLKREASGFNIDDSKKLRKIKRCVMRLIQVASNPLLLSKLEYTEEIPSGILAGATSPKADYAINKALELKALGEKTLIWTNFVDNIKQLVSMAEIRGLNPQFIDGSVKIASNDDDKVNNPHCREYKIDKFLNDENSWVMIANPAAASESISLHSTCHNAIYMDRTYNAGQYLQSLDRIHRLGLPEDKQVVIYIPYHGQDLKFIDYRIMKRLEDKINNMASILNDFSLHPNPIELSTYNQFSDDDVISDDDMSSEIQFLI
jgi:superfamily II DNA or RNA helicase